MKSAGDLLRHRRRTEDLAEAAREKAVRNLERLEHIMDDLDTLRRMVKAWAAGAYREMPWRVITMATAAMIYFVNPLDAIPDVIPFMGFLDDAAMISFVIASIKRELLLFLRWEEQTKPIFEGGNDHEQAE